MKLGGRMTRWLEETTYKFVSEYINHECLWNVTNENYKNKQIRDIAYSELQEVMAIKGFGKREIIQKIRNIKSTYHQERRKIKDSLHRSGSGVPYTPTIKWYKILDNALNLVDESNGKVEMNNDFSEHIAEDDTEETKIFQERLTPTVTDLPPTSTEYSPDINHFSTSIADDETEEIKVYHERLTPIAMNSPPKNTRLTLGKKRKVQQVEEFVTNVKELKNVINRHIERNEFEVFGHNIGLQLKNMPIYLALEAQEHIQTYLTRLRLQHLHQQCNVGSRPSSAFLTVSQSHCATPSAPSPTCSLHIYSDSSLNEIQDIIEHDAVPNAKSNNILVHKTETEQ